MKPYFFKLASILIMILLAFPASAEDTYNRNTQLGNFVLVGLTPYPRDYEKPDIPEKGGRDTPEHIPACISDGGISIERVSESEIESYDIYASSGIQVGSFLSGAEFATTLFSLEGEYEVRFTTSEYVYIGYVWME